MEIKEIKTKNVLVKSNLPDADYVINPYTGCVHGCIYCYASFMKRFTNHPEKWGDFIDVKINAAESLGDTEKLRKKLKGKSIFMSSVTDPYNPFEAKYKITRGILEKLLPIQPNLEILTKNMLITRDIDLLRKFKNLEVGISLSTLDSDLSKKLEPLASAPQLRIEALKKCKEAGIVTYAFISPIFPYITDIKKILDKTDFVDYFMFENLNVRPNNKQEIFDFIKKNKPELIGKYKEIYDKKNREYWNDLEKEIKRIYKKKGKECRIYFHHGGFS